MKPPSKETASEYVVTLRYNSSLGKNPFRVYYRDNVNYTIPIDATANAVFLKDLAGVVNAARRMCGKEKKSELNEKTTA